MKFFLLRMCLAAMCTMSGATGGAQFRQPIPRTLDAQVLAKQEQVLRQYRFRLSSGTGSGSQLDAGFRECLGLDAGVSGAGTGTGTTGSRSSMRLVLKSGTIRRPVLDEWLAQIRSGGPGARRRITLQLMNSDRSQIIKSWRLAGALVGQYQALPGLNADATMVAIDSLELSYEALELDGDPLP